MEANSSGTTPEVNGAVSNEMIFRTPQEIQQRRGQVLDRYEAFKSATRERRFKLEEAHKYQLFKRDADELEAWILEKLQTLNEDPSKETSSLPSKFQKHQTFEAEVAAHEITLRSLDNSGGEMIENQHYASEKIKTSLDELHRLWDLLLRRVSERGHQLKLAMDLAAYLEKADELLYWIREKRAFVERVDLGTQLENLGQLPILLRNFTEFVQELHAHQAIYEDTLNQGGSLIQSGHPDSAVVEGKQQGLVAEWEGLKLLSQIKYAKLTDANEIQQFFATANEMTSWIEEKDASLSNDYGRDLPSVEALQRRHDALLRDLQALRDKVRKLQSQVPPLIQKHPENKEQITQKYENVEHLWRALEAKANERSERLDENFKLHKFLSDERELTGWLRDMRVRMQAEELARDVTSAEAQVELHHEHKYELEAREPAFREFAKDGEQLLQNEHYTKEEISDALMRLAQEKYALTELWDERKQIYYSCMKLQIFYRDLDQAETWLSKYEAAVEKLPTEKPTSLSLKEQYPSLANVPDSELRDSMDSLDSLVRKHEDFSKSLAAQEEKVRALDQLASSLISQDHYASDEIASRRDALLARRAALREKAKAKRDQLDDGLRYVLFDRDAEEMRSWLDEKLAATLDQAFKAQPSGNVQAKFQKHQSFENELLANAPRYEHILEDGRKLIDASHEHAPAIEERMEELKNLRGQLEAASSSKGDYLRQLKDEKQLQLNLDDFEMWLTDVEAQLASDDFGRDLPSVDSLQKKHEQLESDVAAHQDRVEAFRSQLNRLGDKAHLQAEGIPAREQADEQRYQALEPAMAARREKLKQAKNLYRFLRDLDDEHDWIREKEPLVSSQSRGRDVISVESLIQKHQVHLLEITSHEPHVQKLLDTGRKMIETQQFDFPEVERRLGELQSKWDGLKEKAAARKQLLEDSMQAQQYLADANEAESWMNEKEPVVGYADYGKDEDTTEPLLIRHECLMRDIEAFRSTIKSLRQQADNCNMQDSRGTDESGREYVVALFDYKPRNAREFPMQKDQVLVLLDTPNKEWWKVELGDRQGYVPSTYVQKLGNTMAVAPPGSFSIPRRQNQIEDQYERLLQLGRQRQLKLEESARAYKLVREANEMASWIIEKETTTLHEDTNESLAQVEDQQKKFDEMKKEMKDREEKLKKMSELAEHLSAIGQTEAAEKIIQQFEALTSKWVQFEAVASERAQELINAHEVQRFHQEADDLKDWILEKRTQLLSEELGKDLPSVQRLLRKHEGIESDLAAIQDRVRAQDQKASELINRHPEQAEGIYNHQKEVNDLWAQMTALCQARKHKLDDNYDYQRFCSDYLELLSWIQSMMSFVSSSELPKDIAGVETFLDRHQSYHTEIETRAPSFDKLNAFGAQLLKDKHYESANIQEKLQSLAEARADLEKAWMTRRGILDQCLSEQLLFRECEQAEAWMAMREAALVAQAAQGDTVDQALRRHEDINRAISLQEEKIERLKQHADALILEGHFDSPAIKQRCDAVLERWAKLRDALLAQRAKLAEAQNLQDFIRDADEVEIFLTNKHGQASDESFRDPTNVQAKFKKQEAFAAELVAHKNQVEAILGTGNRLIDTNNCIGQDETVKERLNHINKLWSFLIEKSAEKSALLKDANRIAVFNAALKSIELWLQETEAALLNEDLGKDLNYAITLNQKHEVLEADVKAHEGRINDLNRQVEEIVSLAVANEGVIRERIGRINQRYLVIKERVVDRRLKLSDALRTHKFFHEIDDEEAWIREKKLHASSTDYGRDLNAAENLQKRQKRLEGEIEAHEPIFKKILDDGQAIIDDPSQPEAFRESIRERLGMLNEHWSELQMLASTRSKMLDQNLEYQRFLTKLGEELGWLREKQHILSSKDLGETLPTVKSFQKKHTALEAETVMRETYIENVKQDGDALIAANNYHQRDIEERCADLLHNLEMLKISAGLRKQALADNLSYLEFLWRVEIVESWIKDREGLLRRSDYGQDLSTVRMSLEKQDAYEHWLNMFERDQFTPITSLKDQLLSANHVRSADIQDRYNALLGRWDNVRRATQEWKDKLLKLKQYYLDIDELLMLFAKKASAFNSWVENAKEDANEVVRCESVEEVEKVKKNQEDFKQTLVKASHDLEELEALHQRIQSYVPGIQNPYSWYTIEDLEEKWRTLHEMVNHHDREILREEERQREDDALRHKFADMANEFHEWIQSVRVELMETTGSLEEQLDSLRERALEVMGRKPHLKDIEALALQLEKRKIFRNPYTDQTHVSVAQQWDQLEQFAMRLQHNLEQQVQARNQAGVSSESLREYTMMFKHFDKEKAGRLTHAAFKTCLQALGISLPPVLEGEREAEFEHILDFVDPNRDGFVPMQEYMEYMISRESENAHTREDVEDSFRALTDGRKPYITRRELEASLSPDQVQFCMRSIPPYHDSTGREVAEAYDYKAYCARMFQG